MLQRTQCLFVFIEGVFDQSHPLLRVKTYCVRSLTGE